MGTLGRFPAAHDICRQDISKSPHHNQVQWVCRGYSVLTEHGARQIFYPGMQLCKGFQVDNFLLRKQRLNFQVGKVLVMQQGFKIKLFIVVCIKTGYRGNEKK